MKIKAEFGTLDFMEGRKVGAVKAESTDLTDAQGVPLIRVSLGPSTYLIRLSDLASLVQIFSPIRP